MIRISDALGIDANSDFPQSKLLYIYDDGRIERKYIVK